MNDETSKNQATGGIAWSPDHGNDTQCASVLGYRLESFFDEGKFGVAARHGDDDEWYSVTGRHEKLEDALKDAHMWVYGQAREFVGNDSSLASQPAEQPIDSERHDALCESQYAAGMKLGWNLCVAGKEVEFNEIVEARSRAACSVLKAPAEQPRGEPVQRYRVRIEPDGDALDGFVAVPVEADDGDLVMYADHCAALATPPKPEQDHSRDATKMIGQAVGDGVACPGCFGAAVKDHDSVSCNRCEKLWPLSQYETYLVEAVRKHIEAATLEHCRGGDLYLSTWIAAKEIVGAVTPRPAVAPTVKRSLSKKGAFDYIEPELQKTIRPAVATPEIEGWEQFAHVNSLDMKKHRHHYLFLDEKTGIARQAWLAAIRFTIANYVPDGATPAEVTDVVSELGRMAVEGGVSMDAHDMSVMCSQLADRLTALTSQCQVRKDGQGPAELRKVVEWHRTQEAIAVQDKYPRKAQRHRKMAFTIEAALASPSAGAVVPEAITSNDVMDRRLGNMTWGKAGAITFAQGWNACRDAVLAAAPEVLGHG